MAGDISFAFHKAAVLCHAEHVPARLRSHDGREAPLRDAHEVAEIAGAEAEFAERLGLSDVASRIEGGGGSMLIGKETSTNKRVHCELWAVNKEGGQMHILPWLTTAQVAQVSADNDALGWRGTLVSSLLCCLARCGRQEST